MSAVIEAAAEKLLEDHECCWTDGSVDVARIMHRLGGRVEMLFGDDDLSESLLVRSSNDFVVFVPWNTSIARDRFTIAHELGHLMLHYSDSPHLQTFNRYGRSRQEWEANVFAAALLMPSKDFRSAWHELNGNLTEIAKRFGVSRSAARVRATVLNCA